MISTKKLINLCIEKYPEVAYFDKLFELDSSHVKKVIAEDYSYTPTEPNKKVIEDKVYLSIKNINQKFTSLQEYMDCLQNRVEMELKPYGIDASTAKNFKIYNSYSEISVSFSTSRMEYQGEYAERIVNDYEEKCLFEVSHFINAEYQKILKSSTEKNVKKVK